MINKTETARQYVEKYIELALKNKTQYSKRFIANVILAENPDMYRDEDDARQCVRAVTGSMPRAKSGKQTKKYEDLARQFALLPKAIEETTTSDPFIVPVSIKKGLWMSDIHGLFYDRKAFETAIEYGIKKGCDSVVINGDFMDFYGHSRWDKNPLTAARFFEEQDWGIDVLRLLQSAFGYVVLKEGNHDARREWHVAKLSATMPELMGLSSYRDHLFFDGCTVNFVEDYRHIIFGKLNGFHGHEYFGGGGIHVAYNRFNKALDNIITGHSHKSQSVIKKNINGHIYGSWALGCLCQLAPRYAPKNDWNHGFAVVEKDSEGNFEVDNRIIYNGRTYTA